MCVYLQFTQNDGDMARDCSRRRSPMHRGQMISHSSKCLYSSFDRRSNEDSVGKGFRFLPFPVPHPASFLAWSLGQAYHGGDEDVIVTLRPASVSLRHRYWDDWRGPICCTRSRSRWPRSGLLVLFHHRLTHYGKASRRTGQTLDP